MTRDDYAYAVRSSRGWADPNGRAVPISPARLSKTLGSVGLYFAVGIDGVLDYIGSAVRPTSATGIADRVREHPASRRRNWLGIWILPLRLDTPRAVVHALEGEMIHHFSPRGNTALPRPRSVQFPSATAETLQ